MSSLAVQKAIIAKIKASTVLQALIANPVPIFEYVPENTPPLYLMYTDLATSEFNTITDRGGDHSIRISCYSYYEGSLKIRQVLEAIRTLLDYQPLTLDSGRATLVQTTAISVMNTLDKTFVGTLSLQILTEEWS